MEEKEASLLSSAMQRANGFRHALLGSTIDPDAAAGRDSLNALLDQYASMKEAANNHFKCGQTVHASVMYYSISSILGQPDIIELARSTGVVGRCKALYVCCILNEAQARLSCWGITMVPEWHMKSDLPRDAFEVDMQRVLRLCADVLMEEPRN